MNAMLRGGSLNPPKSRSHEETRKKKLSSMQVLPSGATTGPRLTLLYGVPTSRELVSEVQAKDARIYPLRSNLGGAWCRGT